VEIRKIITLEPSSTEVVSFLDGDTSRIVNVSNKCDYPPEIISKPKIVKSLINVSEEMSSLEIDKEVKKHLASGKPIYEIDWNAIKEIKPDLLVGQSICGVCAFPINSLLSHPHNRISLEEFLIYDYSPRNFYEIFLQIYELSKIIGRKNKAEELLEYLYFFEKELKYLGKSRRIVMLEWIMPIYVAGLWISQIIEICNAKTLIASGEEGRNVDWDMIRNFDPDIILISPCGFGIKRTLKEIDLLYSLPGWKDTRAFIKKNIYVVDSVYTSRATPRIVEFVKNFMEILNENEPRREVMIRLE